MALRMILNAALFLLVTTVSACIDNKSQDAAVRSLESENFFQLKSGIKSYFKETTESVTNPQTNFCHLKPEKKYTFSGQARLESGHYRVSVTNSEFDCAFRDGYVFAEHVILSQNSAGEKDVVGKRLSVPYFCQMKNQLRPSGSCSNTALAMVMAFHGKSSITGHGTLADQILREDQSLIDEPSTEKIKQTAIRLGLKATAFIPGTMNQIKQEIDQGRPVIVGGDFVGKKGHFVVVTGFDDKGFFVNDPYGLWDQKTLSPSDGYREKLCNNGYSGQNLHYSYTAMEKAAGAAGFYLVFIRR